MHYSVMQINSVISSLNCLQLPEFGHGMFEKTDSREAKKKKEMKYLNMEPGICLEPDIDRPANTTVSQVIKKKKL